MSRRRVPWALVGLLLVAFALRIFRLDAQSLWWDEGISLHLATSSVAELLLDRVNNIHPPLYFLLLKGWLALTGVSAFTGRYLSVLASWAQITAVFVVARRWFRPPATWLAAGLALVSAVSVIYGQEIRVYAMLPLVYLALFGLTDAILSGSNTHPGWRPFVWLAVATWTGLHLHYIALFVVMYVNLWALLALVRTRRWAVLRRWVAAQALAGIASLPWLTAVIANLTAVQAEASAGTFATEAIPGGFLVSQIWVFHLTGLANALARPEIRWLAGTTAVALLLLTLLRLWQPDTRRRTLALWSHWLLPLSSATVVWTVRSFSHPRYVVMFTAGLLLLVAYLGAPGVASRRAWERVAGRLLGALLAGAVVCASLWGLWHYFFDPAVAKDDMRGVARYLEATAGADDLILVPDTDWSLPFEYAGATPLAMPRPGEAGFWDDMATWTSDVATVYVVDYPRGTRDWQRQIPFALEAAGVRRDSVLFDGLQVDAYALDTAVSPPALEPAANRIGPLQLQEVWLEQGAATNSAVALSLRWELLEPVDGRVQVALRLVDEVTGAVLYTADDRLVDGSGRPTDQWPAGQTVTTYHLLPLPQGTPPLTYAVDLSAYVPLSEGVRPLERLDAAGAPQGQIVRLGTTMLTRSLATSAYFAPVDAATLARLAPGLTLEAAAVGTTEAAAGQPLAIDLRWRADGPLADVRPAVVLRAPDGTVLAMDDAPPANGRYPTNRWQTGELVRERRRLVVPATAGGVLDVVVQLDGTAVPIGLVAIVPGALSFEPPPVGYPLDVVFGDIGRLVGFDLPALDVANDEPVPLTLVWQALRDDIATDYVVFAHVLAGDGWLVGQQDGVPGDGRYPTTGWQAGAYIIDPHAMTFREPYTGMAVIEVGLYDPLTGARVLLADGRDHFVLPVELSVSGGE